MAGGDMRDWLDGLVRDYPDRTSGEDLQRFVSRQCISAVQEQRDALVAALTDWLGRHQEPHSMLAVRIAAEHGLFELRVPIGDLLSAVQSGVAFKPQLRSYYVARLQDALAQL